MNEEVKGLELLRKEKVIRENLLREELVNYIRVNEASNEIEIIDDVDELFSNDKLEDFLLGKFKDEKKNPFDRYNEFTVRRYGILINSIREKETLDGKRNLYEVLADFEKEQAEKNKIVYIIHSSDEFKTKSFFDFILDTDNISSFAYALDMIIKSDYIIEDKNGLRFPLDDDYYEMKKYLEKRTVTRFNVVDWQGRKAFLPEKRKFKQTITVNDKFEE